MNVIDKIVVTLMGFGVICAILTLVSYILYNIFNLQYFLCVYWVCIFSMIGAVGFIGVATMMLNKNDVKK